MSLEASVNDTIEENIARAEEAAIVEEVATEVDSDKALFEDIANEYGELFLRECAFVPGSTLKEFDDAVEKIMENLDSYAVSIDKMRSDVEFCNENVLPTIMMRLNAIQPLFARIDSLEAYVEAVRSRTDEMESVLRAAEAQLPVRGGPVSNAVRNFFRDALPKPPLPVSQPAFLNGQPALATNAQSGAFASNAQTSLVTVSSSTNRVSEPVPVGPLYVPVPKIPLPFRTDDIFQN